MMDDGKTDHEITPRPPERNKTTLIVGFAALFVAVGVLAGVIYGAANYLSPGQNDVRAAEAQSVSVASTGFAALDEWNIAGKKMKYAELEDKYLRLYNYTYPFLLKEAIKSEIIPSGVPAVYGAELGVDFEANTDKMTTILRSYEDKPLNDEQMARYKDVGLRIACEYCCGAKALIFENGERACGCAHSYAMRGLAKYLIINHPEEYSNDEILLELGKWKATFFPKQTISKAVVKYAELGNIDPSILTDMPNMVGSC